MEAAAGTASDAARLGRDIGSHLMSSATVCVASDGRGLMILNRGATVPPLTVVLNGRSIEEVIHSKPSV